MTDPSNFDQRYIKHQNIQKTLAVLNEHHPLSRTDLARMTQMSPTSITRIINALCALGLVTEISSARSAGRGRKAVNLDKCPDGLYTLGYYMERDRLEMTLIDFEQRVCRRDSQCLDGLPLTPEGLAKTARAMYDRLLQTIPQQAARVRAVGVCVPGLVLPTDGMVVRSEQFRWTDAALGRPFAAAFSLPVTVENDVKTCLIGEMITRGIPLSEDTFYLYIGRNGIGGAAAANGSLIRGQNNAAGEIGCLPLEAEDRLDAHLLSSEIIKRAQTAEASVQTPADIIAGYRLNLPWAVLLVNDFRRLLTLILRLIRGLFSPARVFLGGQTICDFAEILRDLFDEKTLLAGNFPTTCAFGAAALAMDDAVARMLEDELN